MQVSTILNYIDNGHMALPEFRRGNVWSCDQGPRLVRVDQRAAEALQTEGAPTLSPEDDRDGCTVPIQV